MQSSHLNYGLTLFLQPGCFTASGLFGSQPAFIRTVTILDEPNGCVLALVVTDTLCDMGMIEQLINLLRCEQAAYHEHLVRALVNLVTDHCRSLEECRRSELTLYNLLKQLFSDLQGKPEFQVGRGGGIAGGFEGAS